MSAPPPSAAGPSAATTPRKPTAEEICEFAVYIGMDPIADLDLLWIAEEALLAPLPPGWEEHKDDAGDRYWYDTRDRSTTWTDPRQGLGEVARAKAAAAERRAAAARAGHKGAGAAQLCAGNELSDATVVQAYPLGQRPRVNSLRKLGF